MFDWPLQPEAVRLLPATEVATLEIVRIDLDHKARVLAQKDQCRALLEIDLLPARAFRRHWRAVDLHLFGPCGRRATGQGCNNRNDFDGLQNEPLRFRPTMSVQG